MRIWPALLAALLLFSVACSTDDTATIDDSATIDDYFQLDSFEEHEQMSRIIHQRTEEFVVTCMAQQGWDYLPLPFPGVAAWRPTTRQEAEEIRFGITRAAPEIVNPNDPFLESLSQDERNEWINALLGDNRCFDQADAEFQAPIRDAQAVVFDAASDVRERIAADPRTLALDAQWADCIRNSPAGLVVENYNDLVETVFAELEPILLESEEAPPEAVERETIVALAAWDCESDLASQRLAIRAEYEAELIEEFGTQLLYVRDQLETFIKQTS